MTMIRILIAMMCITCVAPLAFAQNAIQPRISPSDAKNHVGETVTTCGKVVGSWVAKYGLAGHGKPVDFDLDQPEPNPVFHFVTFGSQTGGPPEAIAAYQGKRVCVTGKINTSPGGPFIMAVDRSQIKLQPEDK
jgi:hypothetical protein